MITKMNKLIIVVALFAISLFAVANSAQAVILGPYTADANTVHLWQFDEAATTVWNQSDRTYPNDAPGVLTPWRLDQAYADSMFQAAFMGGPGTGYTGFGGAGAHKIGNPNRFEFRKGRTQYGTPPNGTPQGAPESSTTLLGSAAGAFTIEGLIKPSTSGAIIGNPGDDDPSNLSLNLNSLAGPTFGFRLPNGDFFTTSNSIPNIVAGDWYHWALTFDGNNAGGSDAKFYWTKMDPSAPSANLVQTFSSSNTTPYVTQAFQLGHWQGAVFEGYTDEVRISNIARGANQFLFGPESGGGGGEVVPEPSTYALGLIGLAGLGLLAWRRRRRS